MERAQGKVGERTEVNQKLRECVLRPIGEGCQIVDGEGRSHSKLTEEGRDRFTFDWSHARLDSLCQYRNGKLVDKEVDAEILQLAGYFSDAEDEEDEGRLDEIVEAVTRQADVEGAAVKDSQKDSKETADAEADNKEEQTPSPPIYIYLFSCFVFSYLLF